MASPYAILGTGAGAAQGLQELLARRLMAQKQAEVERQAQAEEAFRQQQLGEQMKMRQATQASTDQERQFQHQLRYDQLGQAKSIADANRGGLMERFLQGQTGMNERASESRKLQESLRGMGLAIQGGNLDLRERESARDARETKDKEFQHWVNQEKSVLDNQLRHIKGLYKDVNVEAAEEAKAYTNFEQKVAALEAKYYGGGSSAVPLPGKPKTRRQLAPGVFVTVD
mgnify:CR=1 FL=1